MRVQLFTLILLCPTLVGTSACSGAEGMDVGARTARIVSLHDTTTEMLVGVGAATDLLAIVEPIDLSETANEAIAGVRRLPRGPHSVEALLALEPTHVFGTDATIESQPGLGSALELAGIDAHFLDPRGLTGLWESIAGMGVVVGRQSAARAWIERLEARVADFATDASSAAAEPVRVFFYDCCDPPFTAGGPVPLSELLEKLGARNVFDDLDQDWSRVSWEAVIERQPELIVVHDYQHPGQGTVADKISRLGRAPLGERLPAMRNGMFVSLPLALALEGPRSLEALPLLEPHIEAARAARAATTEERKR